MLSKNGKPVDEQRISYRVILQAFRTFGRFYKKHWPLIGLAFTGLILSVLIALLLPWPLKLILDYVILKNPLPQDVTFLTDWFGEAPEAMLGPLVVAFILLNILNSIFSYIHKIGLLSAGEKIIMDVREFIFAHLQRLSLSYHGDKKSGDLVYRVITDVRELRTILVQVPQELVYRLIMIASHIGLMMLLEWRLALVAFSVLPILYFYHIRIGTGVQKATKEKKSKQSEMASLIAENVMAMALVKAYGQEDLQKKRFEKENRQSMDSGITAMRLAKKFRRFNDILTATGTAGVVFYGGWLALEGTILPGTLILFASYLRNLYRPIIKFADMMLKVAKSQVAVKRLMELVECDMVVRDAPDAVPAPKFRGRIEFHHVSFRYHKRGPEVLQDIHFTVHPGETIALVGHSGAGKTTLISLLLRFYDPQKGKILIDGQDIRSYTLKSLREQITVVLQEGRLFNKTIRENIAFGKPDATEEEIIHAARLAQAHEFIMQMPQGYDTMVDEGGENLSGGQRQRIHIARAFIRNTPILILDEPSTALDAKTESKLRQAMRDLLQGKTTFIIAHKFTTLQEVDRIVVLERGRIVGLGSHDKLMQTCLTYQKLFGLQLAAGESYG